MMFGVIIYYLSFLKYKQILHQQSKPTETVLSKENKISYVDSFVCFHALWSKIFSQWKLLHGNIFDRKRKCDASKCFVFFLRWVETKECNIHSDMLSHFGYLPWRKLLCILSSFTSFCNNTSVWCVRCFEKKRSFFLCCNRMQCFFFRSFY
jgi:hypothetical protein